LWTIRIGSHLWQTTFLQSNATWPINTPNIGKAQSIKIGIANNGETADEVAFHAYLPDYSGMPSFSMISEGVAYKAKKTTQTEAREVLKKAREDDSDTAMYIPRPIKVVESNTYVL